jgi:dTDP-3-amino-3,4,6-trideoxy-alpha-D-glucose transaminase
VILANDFQRQWRDTEEAVLAAVRKVGACGWYVLGEELRQFERQLAAQWKMAHAVGVASGLDALEIALRVTGCGPADRVLTTPVSAFATTMAIVRLGATPVYVDIDEHGLIDLAACREVLARRRDIGFVVAVDLYGHVLDPQVVGAMLRDFGCRVVEDCAQSIGATFGGAPAGSGAQIVATSFYPTKNLGALGDGGALVCNDAALAAAARVLRDYGQSAKYCHSRIGYNSRLDELQAAIMRHAYLPKLAEWTARRRAVAARYVAGIGNGAVRVPGAPAGSESCWHLFPVLIASDRKRDFLAYLKGAGIVCGEHYPIAAFDQEAMQQAAFELERDCQRARAWCAREVSLPIHPYLEDTEVERVIEACNAWPG